MLSQIPTLTLAPDDRVVRFHRNAPSTAYGKWLDFWVVDKSYPRRAVQQLLEEPNELGTLGNEFGDHLKHFGRQMPANYKLWRSRVGYIGDPDLQCSALPVGEMGPNPKFPAGRLNLNGQDVFYCAESEHTAVAEIRPGRGYLVTTCSLITKRDLNILDLVDGFEEINPFITSSLSWMLDLRRLFRNLAANASKPTNRGDDEDTYLVTQGAALVARKMSYDGVRVPSSLDHPEGRNVGLFSTADVEFLASRLVKIDNTRVTFSEFSGPA